MARYEKTYLFKPSHFGYNSLFDIGHPEKSKQHVLLYREKLYYFRTEAEKEVFCRAPDAFTSMDTTPLDISIKPKAFALGL